MRINFMKKREGNKPNETNDEMQTLRLEQERAKVRKMKASADQAEIDRDNKKFKIGKEHGDYMRVSEAENAFAGFATRVRVEFDKLIEDENGLRRIVHEQGASCGISEEQLLALDKKLAVAFAFANDGLKEGFAKTRNELERQIEELQKIESKP